MTWVCGEIGEEVVLCRPVGYSEKTLYWYSPGTKCTVVDVTGSDTYPFAHLRMPNGKVVTGVPGDSYLRKHPLVRLAEAAE